MFPGSYVSYNNERYSLIFYCQILAFAKVYHLHKGLSMCTFFFTDTSQSVCTLYIINSLAYKVVWICTLFVQTNLYL